MTKYKTISIPEPLIKKIEIYLNTEKGDIYISISDFVRDALIEKLKRELI